MSNVKVECDCMYATHAELGVVVFEWHRNSPGRPPGWYSARESVMRGDDLADMGAKFYRYEAPQPAKLEFTVPPYEGRSEWLAKDVFVQVYSHGDRAKKVTITVEDL